jgi:hypothetical protein
LSTLESVDKVKEIMKTKTKNILTALALAAVVMTIYVFVVIRVTSS